MFNDIRTFQDLVMPISTVSSCDAKGAASSSWPVGTIRNCGNAVKNVTWSADLDDGSLVKGMESAGSFAGSTNPDTIYKYGVDMDFMGCMVPDSEGSKFWVNISDKRCSAVPKSG